MDESLFDTIRGLAALWDQIAGAPHQSFTDTFLTELCALDRFRVEFPGHPPLFLLYLLRVKACGRLKDRLPGGFGLKVPRWRVEGCN